MLRLTFHSGRDVTILEVGQGQDIVQRGLDELGMGLSMTFVSMCKALVLIPAQEKITTVFKDRIIYSQLPILFPYRILHIYTANI